MPEEAARIFGKRITALHESIAEKYRAKAVREAARLRGRSKVNSIRLVEAEDYRKELKALLKSPKFKSLLPFVAVEGTRVDVNNSPLTRVQLEQLADRVTAETGAKYRIEKGRSQLNMTSAKIRFLREKK